VNPECYIVGELWHEAHRWLQGDQFDAVMNYGLGRAILGFVGERLDADEVARSGYGRVARLSAPGFARAVEEEVGRYERAIVEAQLNLLGSHDTPRLRTMLGGDAEAVRLAMLAQFTLPGAPCLYYGDELGLEGRHDPGCRQGMPWDDPPSWDAETLAWTRALSQLRRDHPALRTGTLDVVYAHRGMVGFRRRHGADDVVIVLNTDGTFTARIALDGETLHPDGPRPVLLGAVEARSEGGRLHVHVPARRGGVVALSPA
jgi:cyclomaltodextrinase / maltogenic alpha-amylase / neopullulanase